MSKLLKCHAVSLPEIQKPTGGKFDETCGVRICLCKESKKKLMMRKVATSRKSKNHNRQSKARHISVC